ncbi:MAG: histidine kinase [Bacteroidota bacterium]
MIRISFFNTNRYGRILKLLAANILLALVVTVVFFKGYSQGPTVFFTSLTWAFAICITQWLGHGYIYDWLDKKYSWHEHLIKRAIYNSLAIILYAVLAYLVVSLIAVRVVYGGFPENPISWSIKSSYYAVLVSFAISIILVAIGFFRKWKNSLLEAERLKGEMLRYKYESLQNQINPHFLFNSFNVLSDLVFEDQNKAVNFIKQLSQLFRYVLDSRDRELVTIAEELEFITSFAFLLQTRFEDKLSITIALKTGKDEMIVPMTLQLLIENCVKHNEISALKPLNINVSRDDHSIKVVNNLQPKNVGIESKETGLSNIIQQYSYFTDRPIVIDKSEEFFSVKVPVLKANNQ